jgi:hypothetical protein
MGGAGACVWFPAGYPRACVDFPSGVWCAMYPQAVARKFQREHGLDEEKVTRLAGVCAGHCCGCCGCYWCAPVHTPTHSLCGLPHVRCTHRDTPAPISFLPPLLRP